jgi:enoyl-CoA hydratase
MDGDNARKGHQANGGFPNLVTRELDQIHWVTINRPEDRNSLDSETLVQLRCHLETAEASGARAIVYEGKGDTYFIGGADGVEMYQHSPAEARHFSTRIQGLFNRMESSPLLLIAAIDGLCFGGGLEFALACDLRVASETSRIGLPEVKLGIIPGGGGTQRLPRLIGIGRAVEMVLTGRLYKAREALDAGLIHEIVAPADIESRVSELAERTKAISAHAFAAAKRAIYASQHLPFTTGLSVESDQFAECFADSTFADLVSEQLADGRLKTTRQHDTQKKVKHGDV